MFGTFSAFRFEWEGVFWMTAEHAYQASKFEEGPIRRQIKKARSPQESYDIAHENEEAVKSDWDEIKVNTMESLLRAKIEQHEYVQKELLGTGNREIIEDSPTDTFWGWGPNKDGENNLGKILMKLRDEFRKKESS